MGGIRVTPEFATSIPGLLAAGEAIGGANGANRLSGNAVTEALVFGRRAGCNAAAYAQRSLARPWHASAASVALDLLQSDYRSGENPAALITALQSVMNDEVGPFRTEAGLERALARFAELRAAMGGAPPPARGGFDARRLDWFDLRNMLLVAETVARAALVRRESRGAHQREDYPAMDDRWRVNQAVRLDGEHVALVCIPVAGATVAAVAS
jgi:succinate dehydrogenase/fumarate reductase flavoprotein subunit